MHLGKGMYNKYKSNLEMYNKIMTLDSSPTRLE